MAMTPITGPQSELNFQYQRALSEIAATIYPRVSDYATLNDALTALGSSTPSFLLINAATTITSNTSVPANITLWPIPGGSVSGSGGTRDLTINGGQLMAGAFQWIGSAVNLKFVQSDSSTNAKIGHVYVEWWDEIAHDSHDSSSAFNSALAAMKTSRGVALRLLARPYRASITIPTPSSAIYPVVIIGSGDGSAIRTNSAASPAISLDLAPGDPNTTLIFRDFSVGGRGAQTAPVMSLKAVGGTDNRFFGILDNIKSVGSGTLADCIYVRGGLALDLNVRTEEGRYALYLEGSSNSIVRCHAGNATCNGIMINGGGNSTIVRARIEDSNTPNTRAVSSISGSGSVVTIVTTTAHNMETMDRITLSGITGATGYNFTTPRRVTVTNSTTFTYAGTETGSGSAGTIKISTSALRLKNTSFNVINDFANEGKENLDYSLWLQSDGDTVTGAPSCSENVFLGGGYAGVSNTVRTTLSTILMEGPCVGNQAYGISVGQSLPYNSNSFEFRFERNALDVRPRRNEFRGTVSSGSGSLNYKFYEETEGVFGNYCELYERAVERTHIYGNRRNLTASDSIDEYQCGTTVFTSGAGSTVLVSVTFDAFPGMRPITFLNNSAQLLRIDPHSTNTIGTGAAGKYLEIAAGGSAVIGCMIANGLDILFSSGTLSYEP